MKTAKETTQQLYTRMVVEQQAWIKSCGGTLAGYVERYGEADDPQRTGDGGEAIYRADTRALARFESLARGSQ
jgi:hypothetical protein